MKAIKTLVLVAVLGLSYTGAVNAQDGTPKPAAKAGQYAPREVGAADFAQMLENMGYEVRTEESADKQNTWIYVKINRSELGGTFEMSISQSSNKKKLWSHIYLAELKAESLDYAAGLQKLLELNAAEGPNHFRLDAKTKGLYLSRCSDVRGQTPALLKEHIENLVEAAIRTKDHWNTTKWGTTSTVQK